MPIKSWDEAQIPDQTGRTFLVTGANSGLGYATARCLLRCGARVIMAVRDEAKAATAATALAGEYPAAALQTRHLDLADLASVGAFCSHLADEQLPIDVLINNAGIMMPPRTLSPQGHELQFATNHLGHFALTIRLLDALRTRPDARVVTVSSLWHKRGTIRFDDLTGATGYRPAEYYAQSKLANTLFGLELDRRLRTANVPIRSVLAHPGYAATNLQSTGPTGLPYLIFKITNRIMAQPARMGALCQLYAATRPDVAGGQFIGPDGTNERTGYPTLVRPSPAATDPQLAERLWRLSEELTGVRFPA